MKSIDMKVFREALSFLEDFNLREIPFKIEIGNKVIYFKARVFLTGYENNWREGLTHTPVPGAGRGSGANFVNYRPVWAIVGKIGKSGGFIELPDGSEYVLSGGQWVNPQE